jgi:adenylate cyclase
MATETERKFLIQGEFRGEVTSETYIIQGYLSSVTERTVRIRIRSGKGYITVKGEAAEGGAARYEWEKEIPLSEAEELLLLCEPGVIEKTRYIIERSNHIYEVDEFHGDNSGLILAEVELSNIDEPFERPSWLGEEVTGDNRYYNSFLAKHPYRKWR